MRFLDRIRRRTDDPAPGTVVHVDGTHQVIDNNGRLRPMTADELAAWEDQQDEQHRIIISPPDETGHRTVSLNPDQEFPMSDPTSIPDRPLTAEEFNARSTTGMPFTRVTPLVEEPTPEPDPINNPATDPRMEAPRPVDPSELCGYCGQRIPDDAAVLRATLDLVTTTGVAAQVVPHFYGILFEIRPETRALFPADMTGQHEKVLSAIAALCTHYGDDETNSDDPELLERQLITMGRAHVRFNLDVRDYADVGTALLRTLAHFAGPHWTPAVEAAWRRAYKYMAGVMLEGESRPNRGAGRGRRRANR